MTAGMAMPPVTAEANTGRIIGAIVGGAFAADEMSKQIKYYNTTEEGMAARHRPLGQQFRERI